MGGSALTVQQKVAFATLGCKVNQYDTDSVRSLFAQRGYTPVAWTEPADVYVINSCTVTSAADRKSRQWIRRARKRSPDAIVVVMGCWSQVAADEALRLPEVDLVLGTYHRARVVDLVEQCRPTRSTEHARSALVPAQSMTEFEELPVTAAAGKTRAVLKIQDGCNNRCSYCRVPLARGPARSRSQASVLRQAEVFLQQGYREVVLTGIHLGSYGSDLSPPSSIAELAAAAARMGFARVRLSSIDPHEVDEPLAHVMAAEPALCRHLHIPLQSGSSRILARMNRRYTAEEYRAVAVWLQSRLPGLALTTDIMVGFPGETEADMLASEALLQDVGFSRLHVFAFSRRPGTKAEQMSGQVAGAVKAERSERLHRLGEQLALQFHNRLIGSTVALLVEDVDCETRQVCGLTDTYVRGTITVPETTPIAAGDPVRAVITQADSTGVVGILKTD